MQFGILGPLLVRSPGGGTVAVGGPRPRALLALLLLDAGRPVSVERIIDGQYGDRPPSGASNAVQAQISRLRRRLPAGLIESHGAGYRLAVDPDAVDAHLFERLAAEGRRLLASGRPSGAATVLREALALWRGPALADVAQAPFAGVQAYRLEELRLTATEDLMEAELALPDGAPVAALRELVAAHPLRERARGLLMRALHAAGRPGAALAEFDEVRRLLADELGADPSPELAALHLEILRGRPRVTRAAPPDQLTSFVGREEELTRLAELRTTRLVTIVGPGGTGKTRLAIEATTRRPGARTHGSAGGRDGGGEVCFVDLSLVEGEVARAVLGALGLREPALRPHTAGLPGPGERLVAALADRDLLLVLDNCEHVIAEAAALARRLLADCTGLTILATSREPLGLTGEHLVPLAPLPVPDGVPAGDPLGYPAVRLFADRAAAVRPGFTVGSGNLDAVLRICAALDGLPLAIELAAARVRTYGVAEIAARLAEHGRFQLLSRGDRTAAARHQTLHAVVEWSWSLLDAEEQALARRFSVFAGGATLAAVERVCGGDGAGPLAGLVDKSLVETDGERYQMLDTIRLFCLERLAAAGEEPRLRQAHAAWCLELARQADPHLYRAEQLDWLATLSADDANLGAALHWSVAHDRPAALRLIATLAMYWWLSGRRGQATHHAVRLLDAIGTEPPAALTDEYVLTVLHAVPDAGSPHWERARAIIESLDRPMRYRFGPALWGMTAGPPGSEEVKGVLAADPWSSALGRLGRSLLTLFDGSVAEAERELVSVLADFGAVGERWGKAQALDWLAHIGSRRGEWARVMGLWEEAVGLLEELGAREELVDVLARRADAHWRSGDAAAAHADYERAADLVRLLGRPDLMAWAHLQLGEIARLNGDLTSAAQRLNAALAGVAPHLDPVAAAIARRPDTAEAITATAQQPDAAIAGAAPRLDPADAAEAGGYHVEVIRGPLLTALGRLAEAAGDVPEAALRHRQALAAALESGLAVELADVAEGLAGHALITGTAERAALLLGAAVALRGTAVAGDRDVARTAAAATDALGHEAFAAAYARGVAMGRDDALTLLGETVSR
ncbi:winged helix-turn-helix domain-containing protein [Nonomuraea sp. K274]|uniref:Winged helix-turn-helix domain-containing protein n=1 Tax=Nonomuraea cypriaca TaxID=1187855 RepID=A0A931F2H9_9ACTN|nr:BTAD domain-containing putative transcriptional regulator [Nonomuraea cypriaca]MBF8188663.1 winged helix-turn-helix domain-containing protein [Nonomuraea cypriaca]